MPGGKSFRDLFDDHTIWINYEPNNNGRNWGWTIPVSYPKDIVITKYALGMGRWTTAATIVHELAHLNGAPGLVIGSYVVRWGGHAAEHTVKACLMKSHHGPYMPGVTG